MKRNLVILDINLLGMDGMETTRRIRALDAGKKMPIIAITFHAMSGDREKANLSGCSGYFEKPIDPLTIVQKMHAVIGLSGAERLEVTR